MPAETGRAGRMAGRFAVALAVAASGLGRRAALADDRYWIAGSGQWDNPLAWSATPGGPGGAGAPVNGANAFVFSNVSITLTRDNTVVSYTPPGLARLDLAGTGALVSVNQTANTMISAIENIGTSGFGQYSQSGGSNIASLLMLGTGTSGAGSYNLNAGTLNATTISIGASSSSTGTFNQNAGTVNATQVSLGSGSASGTYNANGGTLSTTTLLVGTNGAGTFHVGGGTIAISAITVGGSGTGNFTQSSGQTTVTTLNVFHGSSFTSTGGNVVTNGAVTVDGGTLSLASALSLFTGSPSLTVKNGGLVSTSGVLLDGTMSLQSDGVLNATFDVSMFNASDRITLDGGRLTASTISLSGGTVIFNSGTLNLTGSGGLSVAPGGVVANAIDLTPTRSLEIASTTTLVNALSTVTLNGGTFSTGSLAGNGFVVFNSGTFRLSASDLVIGAGGPFGSTFQVTSPMRVEVTGASKKAIINSGALLYMAGGSLSATGITNNGEIQLASGASRIAGGTLTNNGMIDGSGRIENALANSATGTVRAGTPDHLLFTGANNASSGSIQLLGGIVEFQQGLSNTGTISGRGTLIAAGGLSNDGSITFSGGPVDVMGAGTNSPSARVLVTGGAHATFYGAVTNQAGSLFKVSTESIATFLAPVTGLAAFTGAGTTIFESTTTPGPLAVGTSIVETTGNLSATSIRQSALIVRGDAVIVADGSAAGTSVLQSLTIEGSPDAWTGQLDLTNNHLIVDYSGATPIATIANQIKSGFAGNWTGNGITSSTAHTVAIDGSDPHKTALAYADASTLGAGSFAGQPVDSTAVLIGYTYSGDANLDNTVNALDFNTIASHFGATGAVWTSGDFNYDGTVNTLDFNALAANFGYSLPAPVSPIGAAGQLVPEPGALTIFAPALFAAIARRRRSHRRRGGGGNARPLSRRAESR